MTPGAQRSGSPKRDVDSRRMTPATERHVDESKGPGGDVAEAEELADDVWALSTLVHALRAALVVVGLVKGGT